MKKWLSYIWPFTTKVQSKINHTLDVTWINGKKVLDSPNANYSYGSLQKVLEFGLDKIDLSGVTSVLLLGMGGGSVIQSLRERFKYKGTITAVELDEVVVNLAQREFHITESNKLVIHVSDATQFLETYTDYFDLIVVDLFIDTIVPSDFYGYPFWDLVTNHLNEGGQVLFNAGIKLKSDKRCENIVSQLSPKIRCEMYTDVMGYNTLLIGRSVAPSY